jgi:hypothetical protein
LRPSRAARRRLRKTAHRWRSNYGDDRFCLNCQRLVNVDGYYGADGTEYRTEIESFQRVIQHGAPGAQYFHVDHGNGLRSYSARRRTPEPPVTAPRLARGSSRARSISSATRSSTATTNRRRTRLCRRRSRGRTTRARVSSPVTRSELPRFSGHHPKVSGLPTVSRTLRSLTVRHVQMPRG